MAKIILSMNMYDVRRYGRRIHELIEGLAGKDVEVGLFKDTGRVVVEGGNASAEDLRDEIAYGLRVGVTVVSETYAPPKFEFSSDEEY